MKRLRERQAGAAVLLYAMCGNMTRTGRAPVVATFATAQASPSASVPMTRTSSGASTFLLSSTPLADDESTRKRRPSNGEDELEIISKEELEAAREDSDWSDVESAL